MRDPFDLSGDCAYMTIDTDMPCQLPLCTLPAYTEPTYLVPDFGGDFPDIAVPPLCGCLDIEVAGTGRIVASDSPLVVFEAAFTHLTDDCCLQEYGLSFDLEIPCMPLDVTGQAVVAIVNANQQCALSAAPQLAVAFDRNAGVSGTCQLELNLDLDIPCMPLAVSAEGQANVAGHPTGGVLTIALRKQVDTCALALDFNLDIPCLPLTIGLEATARFTTGLRPEINVNSTRELFSCNKIVYTMVPTMMDLIECSLTSVLTPAVVPVTQFYSVDIVTAITHPETQWVCTYDVAMLAFDVCTVVQVPEILLTMEYVTIDVDCVSCVPRAYTSFTGITACTNFELLNTSIQCTYMDVPYFSYMTLPTLMPSVVDTATMVLVTLPVDVTGVALQYVPMQVTVPGTCQTCAWEIGLTLDIPCMPLEATADASVRYTQANPPRFVANVTRAAGPETCALGFSFDLDIPCMPLSVTVTGDAHYTVAATPRFDVSVTRAVGADTCALGLSFDLDIPCMPLSVEITGFAEYVADNVPKFDVGVTRVVGPATCALGLSFDLDIPCMPLSVTVTGDAHYTVAATPKFEVSVTRAVGPATCELGLSFDLDIPCMPLSVAVTGFAEYVAANAPKFEMAVTRVVGPATCELGLSFDLDIPCLPLSVAITGTAEYVAANAVRFDLGVTRIVGPGTCELGLSFDLDIPCMPLSVVAAGNVQFVVGAPNLAVNAERVVGPATCELNLEFDLDIPCLPLSVELSTNAFKIGSLGIVSLSAARLEGTGWITAGPDGTCQLGLSFDLDVPCLPLSVEIETGSIAVSVVPPEDAGLHITAFMTAGDAGTCQMGLSFNLDVPCLPLSVVVVNPSIDIVPPSSAQMGVVAAMAAGPGGTCQLGLDFDFNVPCLPLSVELSTNAFKIGSLGVVSLDAARLEGTGWITAGPDGTCQLGFSFDLDVPCLPLSVELSTGSFAIEVVPPEDAGLHVTAFMTAGDAGTCQMGLSFDLNVPCLPLSVGIATGSFAIEVVPPEDAGFRMTAFMTAGDAGTCQMGLSFDLDVPCLPLSATVTGVMTIMPWETGNPGYMTGWATMLDGPSGTCQLDMNFTLGVPCMPLGIDFNYALGSGLTGTMDMSMKADCTLYHNIDVSIHGEELANMLCAAAAGQVSPSFGSFINTGVGTIMVNNWVTSNAAVLEVTSTSKLTALKDGWYRVSVRGYIQNESVTSPCLEYSGKLWLAKNGAANPIAQIAIQSAEIGNCTTGPVTGIPNLITEFADTHVVQLVAGDYLEVYQDGYDAVWWNVRAAVNLAHRTEWP